MTQNGTRGKRKNMPKKQVQWRRAAATGIASCRVWAKILEFVVGRSITMNSLDWDGIVVRKLSYIQEGCPDYWTLVLCHGEMFSIDRIKTCPTLPIAPAEDRVGYPGAMSLSCLSANDAIKVTNKCVCLISPPHYE